MTVPDFQSLVLLLLKMTVDGKEDTLGEVIETLAKNEDSVRISDGKSSPAATKPG